MWRGEEGFRAVARRGGSGGGGEGRRRGGGEGGRAEGGGSGSGGWRQSSGRDGGGLRAPLPRAAPARLRRRWWREGEVGGGGRGGAPARSGGVFARRVETAAVGGSREELRLPRRERGCPLPALQACSSTRSWAATAKGPRCELASLLPPKNHSNQPNIYLI